MTNLKKISDEELYRQLHAERDHQGAFREMYERYSGPLLRFLYRFTASQEKAEEIIHDIFVQILEADPYDSLHGRFKSWIFTVAKNRGLNHVAKASYESAQPLITAVNESCEGAIIAKDNLRFLKSLENKLPIDLLETWQLRKRGLDHQEISQELKIPVGTVKSRLHRLVNFLREEFFNEQGN